MSTISAGVLLSNSLHVFKRKRCDSLLAFGCGGQLFFFRFVTGSREMIKKRRRRHEKRPRLIPQIKKKANEDSSTRHQTKDEYFNAPAGVQELV